MVQPFCFAVWKIARTHCAARLMNGVDEWRIDREPTLMHKSRQYPEELGHWDRALRDARTQKFAVAYTSYSAVAWSVFG
jgi:hypothetical protein